MSSPSSDVAGGTPPLNGIRVLDFTRFVAGPYATALLADSGAEVIKIEPIGGEETRCLDPMLETPEGPLSMYFSRLNRSKKSLCVDLAHEDSADLILQLVKTVDVVIENFRPGVMARRGIGYEQLSSAKPDLVYCSISGYGHTPSPHRDDPAFAVLAEVSAAVIARKVRPADPPSRMTAPLGDLYPACMALSGVCMALLRRERTGQGSHVDMAMYDAMLSLNEHPIAVAATSGTDLPPSSGPAYAAPFGNFAASDGYICIAVLGEKVWQRFCSAIGRPELGDDASLSSGSLRSQAMDGVLGEIIREWLSARTRSEAVATLVEHGVPAGPVATPLEASAAEQTQVRHMVWDVDTFKHKAVRVVGSPIRVEPAPFAPTTPVPAAGEHTDEILHELVGLSAQEIGALREDGVVG